MTASASPVAAHAEVWGRLGAYLVAAMGLRFSSREDLRRVFRAAAAEFGYDDEVACAQWLVRTPPDAQTLQVLARHLTVGETYFFRDRAALDALETSVLPALIESRRGRMQRLRLWSAACCTGEEAYTLAILLHRLLPDLAQWDVSVIATDINSQFLRKARAGVYGDWSFRDVPAGVRERYFSRDAQGRHQVLPHIRRMVSFGISNLADSAAAGARLDLRAMDVVLCRNMLMYFAPQLIAPVVEHLADALVPDGFLVVGPGETPFLSSTRLQACTHPGATLFRKLPSPLAPPLAGTPPVTRPDHPVAARPSPPPPHRPRSMPPAAPVVVADSATDVADLARQARECANQGRFADALACCDRWLAAQKMNADAHHMRAMVLLETGDTAGASQSLRNALFADAGHVLAHVALGQLLGSQGARPQAVRHFSTALELLRERGPQDVVDESDGLTASALSQALRGLVGAAQVP